MLWRRISWFLKFEFAVKNSVPVDMKLLAHANELSETRRAQIGNNLKRNNSYHLKSTMIFVNSTYEADNELWLPCRGRLICKKSRQPPPGSSVVEKESPSADPCNRVTGKIQPNNVQTVTGHHFLSTITCTSGWQKDVSGGRFHRKSDTSSANCEQNSRDAPRLMAPTLILNTVGICFPLSPPV